MAPAPLPSTSRRKDAQEQLDAILRELAGDIEERDEASQLHTCGVPPVGSRHKLPD